MSDDEVFIFNQFGAMVNLFDGVNNRISVEEIRNQNKELAKNVEELNLNTRKLQSKVDKNIKIISSLKSDVQSLKNNVNSHIQNVARLRKSLYNSKFTKHLYRAWRVLLNDPRYTIDSSMVPRQSPQVTFATHAIRALSSLFRMSAKPSTPICIAVGKFVVIPVTKKIQNLSKRRFIIKSYKLPNLTILAKSI